MTSQDGPSAIEAAWATYVEQITEAIEQGFLDDSIRKIARACFNRRDALKTGEGETPDRMVLPLNPVREVSEEDKRPVPAFAEEAEKYDGDALDNKSLKYVRAQARALGISPIIGVPKTTLISHIRLQERHNKALAEAEVYSEPSKARSVRGQKGVSTGRRRSFSSGDDTFRYIDGHLYNKADVRGKMFQYQEGKGRNRYWGKITGAGPKSFKVTWVHDSSGTPCPDGDQSHMTCAPLKYRDTSAKDGRKVTFMGLSHFEPLMKTITPIKE